MLCTLLRPPGPSGAQSTPLPPSAVEAFCAELASRVAELQRQLHEAKAANMCGWESGFFSGRRRVGEEPGREAVCMCVCVCVRACVCVCVCARARCICI